MADLPDGRLEEVALLAEALRVGEALEELQLGLSRVAKRLHERVGAAPDTGRERGAFFEMRGHPGCLAQAAWRAHASFHGRAKAGRARAAYRRTAAPRMTTKTGTAKSSTATENAISQGIERS